MDIRKLERELTGSILLVTQDATVNVYFATRHGEHPPEPINGDSGKSRAIWNFAKLLNDRAMAVDTVDLAQEGQVPDNCALLVIAGPQADYDESEINAIRNYLNGGGSVLALIDPPLKPEERLLRLRSLFTEYGLNVSDEILADYDSNTAKGSVFVPVIHNYNTLS